jgi:hypothetical protein
MWCAAFFATKQVGEIRGRELCPTTDTVWRYLQGTTVYGPLLAEADRLAQHYRFFHWPLEFPDVARDGGFDLVLGNPPWETTSPDAKEFFAAYDPQVRFMSKEEQTAGFERLKEHPGIAARWDAYCRELYLQTNFYKESGRYGMFAPGNLGKGDLNVYRMFVETALASTKPHGHVAQLVPDGFYNGANSSAIRWALFKDWRLDWLLGFQNLERLWFPEIYYRMKFCMYVARKGEGTGAFRAAFGIVNKRQLQEVMDGRHLTVPTSLVAEFSPDAMAVMEIVAQQDIDICRKMYARYPRFGEQVPGQPHRVYMREVDMGTDRDLFPESATGLPLFEGRMVDHFDYRAKAYVSGRGRAGVWTELLFGDPLKRVVPQWWVPPEMVPKKLLGRISQYRIGFCDVASATNERGLSAALIPPNSVCGDKVPTILFRDGEIATTLLWLAVANSLTTDFIVRKKVALKMSFTVMDSLPFPRDWRKTPCARPIVARACALAACGTEMEGFRKTAPGAPGIPASIEPEETPEPRARLMAEIEVLVAREVYGLSREDLLFILDPDNILGTNSGVETFKTLRNREIRAFGEYRTQRLVLEAWDHLNADGNFAHGAQ